MYKLILKKKAKDLFKKKDFREKTFLNMEDIHSILLFFDTANYEEADAIIEQLQKAGKEVNVYAYKDKNDEYDYSETPYHIISSKDALDWIDNKLDKISEQISAQHYDVLIDLTVKENVAFTLLTAHAQASMKVGYKKNDLPCYDFSISALSNEGETDNLKVQELGKLIIHYLTTIHSHANFNNTVHS